MPTAIKERSSLVYFRDATYFSLHDLSIYSYWRKSQYCLINDRDSQSYPGFTALNVRCLSRRFLKSSEHTLYIRYVSDVSPSELE